MKTIAVALLLLVNFTVSAKFYKGTILLMDGSSKNGYIDLPDYPDDKKLKFREEENGKTEKIEIDLVKSFDIVNDENDTVKYITICLAEPKAFTKNQYKIDNHKSWVKVVKEDKINIYAAYYAYSPGSKTGGGSSIYIQKVNAEYACYLDSSFGGLTFTMGAFANLKRNLENIFENDCPKLAQLLTKEDMKKKGYEYIIELYDKNCGK